MMHTNPMARSVATLAFLALATIGAAQDDPHAGCATTGWVPREILERKVVLQEGTGNAHEEVWTKSKEAQAFYDQGLNYLHGYVWIEAARSFNQALRLDPQLTMARIGLSRVYSGLDDPDAAHRALDSAKSLVNSASARERVRIELRRRQLDAMADLWNETKHQEYKNALDAALAADPTNVEIWLMRGNAEEPSAAGRGQRGTAASVDFYLRVLSLASDNSAAHHYLIHSYETIGRIPEALVHGEAFARLAPAVPHAHHMWGHDLRRVGRIDEAIVAFRKTDELEKAYYARENIRPDLDWHHLHNLDLLATAYQHKGQMRLAETTMRETTALVAPTDRVEFDQKLLSVFLLGRQRWDEALEASRPLTRGRWSATRAVGQALSGHAHLGRGQTDEARAALAAAEREAADVPPRAAGIAVPRGQVQPWIDMLRGELLLRDGEASAARPILEKVAATLRATPGPDAWIQALFRLESIARLARDVEDWDLAEFMARQMLEHDAAYGGSHLALALVADHRKDAVSAAREFASAESYWKDADGDLPELKLVRAKRAQWDEAVERERGATS